MASNDRLTPAAMSAAGVPCQPCCVKVTLKAQGALLTCLPAAYVPQAAAFADQHLLDPLSLKQALGGTDPAGQMLFMPLHHGLQFRSYVHEIQYA